MRLHLQSALVVCLCLWIPVAQSNGALTSGDQEGSGDDDYEFSASGSGDGDIWFIEPEVTTQASSNTTEPAWLTDTPVILPEHSVTEFGNHNLESETPGHITEAPLQYTTQITETQPSPVIIKSLGSEEDQKGETTTVSDVAQPETTVPSADKLPVVPMHEEEYTTKAYDEDTKESSVIDQEEEETTVLVESGPMTTEASDVETTTLHLSTTAARKLADSEASGDAVESTTIKVIDENSFDKNVIPEETEPTSEQPTMIDDFEFDNEIKEKGRSGGGPLGSASGSDFSLGSASNNDSLLERKEVLAGVIAGGVVGLAFAIMLVALMVYRMKKKDEGSYSLDEHKHPNGGYQKPQRQEEFLA